MRKNLIPCLVPVLFLSTAFFGATAANAGDELDFLAGLGGGLAKEWEKTVDEMPPLMRAAYYNDLDGVRRALRSGARVNEASSDERYTALMWAASNAGPEVVKALLEAGADVNAGDNFGNTPIMWAAGGGASSLATMLGTFSPDGPANQAVAWLLRGEKGNPDAGAVIPLFLERGVRADVPMPDGKTPLQWAQEQGNEAAVAALGRPAAPRGPPPSAELLRRWKDKPAAVHIIGKMERIYGRSLTAEETEHWNEVFTDMPPFIDAIFNGNLEEVRRLLAENHDVDEKYKSDTALGWAAYYAGPEMTRTLLDAGADIDAKDEFDSTPLMRACAWSDDIEVIRTLLHYGAGVGTRGKTGWSASHWAAKWSSRPTEALELLADYGDDFHSIGQTPTHVELANANPWTKDGTLEALWRLPASPGPTRLLRDTLNRRNPAADIATVRDLLARGADPNGRVSRGVSFLLSAALAADNPDRKAIFRMLLDGGADMRIAGPNGDGILANAFLMEDETFLFLLDNGADPNFVYRIGNSAMHILGFYRPPEKLSAAIRHGGDINNRSRRGQTPLMWAARNENVDNISSLVANGARTEDRDNEGRTAVIIAARRNCAKNIASLAQSGADLNAADNYGNTALHHLAFVGIEDPADVLDALLAAGGAEPERRNNGGNTPLMLAVYHKKAALAKALAATKKGLDIPDNAGDTPLHYAVYRCRDDKVFSEALIANGADVNARGENGAPPLFWAACNPTPDMLRLLVDAGADMRALATGGSNALMWAAGNGSSQEIIAILARAGVDVNHRDQEGRTPLAYAALFNQNAAADIILALARNGANIAVGETDPLQDALAIAREKNNVEAEVALRLLERRREKTQ